jgi:RHS repeat-associated protein
MDASAKTIGYAYDPVGNRSRMTDPDGGRFTYSYDAASQLTLLQNPQHDRTSFTYDASGRRTLKELANGTRASFSYDDAGNMTRIANLKSDLTTISSYGYSYNAANKRTQIVANDGSVTTYAYDNISQLTAESRSGTNPSRNTFTYDAVQNRTLKNESGSRTTYSYDAANQLTTSLAAGGTTTYTFDANGNQALIQAPDGTRTTTTWDYENRSIVIATPTNGIQTQAYDPDGLRVKLQDAEGTRHFTYDGQAYLLETDGSNATQAVYTQEPTIYGYLASQYRFNGSIWVPSYCQQDALGSTMQLTDGSENVTDTYLYDAWGDLVSRTGTTVNPFQWIGAWGYYKDETTGLYYVRQRDYQISTGRWTSTDSLLFINGPNLYTAYFVPNGIDPSGLAITRCTGVGGGFIFALGGELSILHCTDDCGNYAWIAVPSARVGVGFSLGGITNKLPGSLPSNLGTGGAVLDFQASGNLGPLGAGASVGTSGLGVQGSLGIGAEVSGGFTVAGILTALPHDLSNKCC